MPRGTDEIHDQLHCAANPVQGSGIGAAIGWLVAETDNVMKLYEWTARWSDLLTFTVVPVLEDAELGQVLRDIG